MAASKRRNGSGAAEMSDLGAWPHGQAAPKRALVVGAGRSGVAAAKALVALGASVAVTDRKREGDLGAEMEELRRLGVELALGAHATELLAGVDLVVVSPGVPSDLPLLQAARQRPIPDQPGRMVEVIGEMEFAARLINAPCAAISGTNGKSTTTLLLGAMAAAAGRRVFVGGNLGQPLSAALFPPVPWELLVVEVSSFQLETIRTFHPSCAALLNITADHLDRYPSFDDYVAAKRRLFLNASSDDTAVLNAADPIVRAIGRELPCRVIWFAEGPTEGDAVWCAGGVVRMRVGGREEMLWPVGSLRLPGRHLLQNALAATAMARTLGVPAEAIELAVREFQGQEHCLETVAERAGVLYINDSKGTNVDAVVNALNSFDRPTIWIGGGLDKGGRFELLRPAIAPQTKRAILFGAARRTIARALEGTTAIEEVETLEEAVQAAATSAAAGDVVLFSPACASFDQFRDYRERGEQFRACVRALG
ncbi:MAG: UDP-N-acetylmuramoyl-L-alanine--D-glutamate ligase [Nitrospirae bacterium]|nr:UDP-N-acetylmuramoyl-L-alanine--D-glutamate ligase [Nitrospirota bacterium]